jgi:ribosomal protein S18 acetylase RimI-like enzyme
VAFAESSDDGGQVTLKQLYVLPGLQGRGIGGMLLDEVIESFPEASTIRLEVEEKNTKAVAFYEANGFVRTEEVGVRARDAGNTLVFRRSLAG